MSTATISNTANVPLSSEFVWLVLTSWGFGPPSLIQPHRAHQQPVGEQWHLLLWLSQHQPQPLRSLATSTRSRGKLRMVVPVWHCLAHCPLVWCLLPRQQQLQLPRFQLTISKGYYFDFCHCLSSSASIFWFIFVCKKTWDLYLLHNWSQLRWWGWKFSRWIKANENTRWQTMIKGERKGGWMSFGSWVIYFGFFQPK